MPSALAADGLTDAAVMHVGVGPLLLFLFGAVLSANAIALSAGTSASGATSERWGVAVYLAAFALALAAVSPGTTASWALLGYIAAV